MKGSGLVALAAMIVGIAGLLPAGAGEYTGPGFSGVAWYGENGAADRQLGPIYVDKQGFRMEVHEQGQYIAVLAFWDREVSYSLMMDQKMYMEVPGEQTGSTPADFEGKPCDGYGGADKVGSESVNGRATEKWRCTGELEPVPGEAPADSTSWFDPELVFPIRETKDNGEVFEVRDIAVGPQDASLFEIPPGFQELDMNAIMQQMMQQQQGQ